ncbi:hypothetical protein BJ322DRAFT_1092908 [Thelephora terrestris]|uniref:Tetratricopeptide SHNi-TPR domain-containing protein n=1 Tax=Thelephora terrestris TaxID=56493 RepID=A0A9P6L1R9_9AGAM|nr:hypothetical protein BJ322DRAFT_1092908 [Thelephora terrestris]
MTGETSEQKPQLSAEETIEHAKRAFALKKYEQAVDYYATALELKTEELGEDSPEIADLYLAYGKALLENAITQSSVLGKNQPEGDDEAEGSSSEANKLGGFLSFSGDAEDEPVDMFAEAEKAAEQEEEEEDPDAEPEDDFNAAWEVLDLARAIFEKQKDEDDMAKLKLADTYMCLGDVSLETEKFDQAVKDYTTGLILKQELLPLSSRHIAEAHYRLCLVLDMTPGQLSSAISHVEKALQSVEARIGELRVGPQQQSAPPSSASDSKGKGKGKAVASSLLKGDAVQDLSPQEIEAELKEMDELRSDLMLKIEELKTAPEDDASASAPELVAKALDKELNATRPTTNITTETKVNDLTSIVKKKKKPLVNIPEPNGAVTQPLAVASGSSSTKRKADDDLQEGDKKPKLSPL